MQKCQAELGWTGQAGLLLGCSRLWSGRSSCMHPFLVCLPSSRCKPVSKACRASRGKHR